MSATTEIIPYKPEQHTELVARIRAIDVLRQSEVFIKGVHYGEPYKDAGKDVLLKPGAETIMSRFLLWPEFIERSKVETWDTEKPLFHYRYECRLIHRETGEIWGAGIGSCNSMENKYRWRNQGRICPKCGAENIRVSKRGGGYYCWDKTGGCGANFKEDDPDIVNQVTGKVPNDDIFTLVNTLDKMAQKRALIAAVLVATGASAYFTQDVEEFPDYTGVVYDGDTGEVVDSTYTEITPAPEPDESPVPAQHDRAASTQDPETRDVAHETPPAAREDDTPHWFKQGALRKNYEGALGNMRKRAGLTDAMYYRAIGWTGKVEPSEDQIDGLMLKFATAGDALTALQHELANVPDTIAN